MMISQQLLTFLVTYKLYNLCNTYYSMVGRSIANIYDQSANIICTEVPR